MFSLRRFHSVLIAPLLLPLWLVLNTSESDNHPPIAVDDQARIHASGLIPVTANDSEPDNEAFFVTGIPVPPSHGTIANIALGNIFYVATTGYVGSDSFTYKICDVAQACATAAVSVNVENNAPVGQPDSFNIHGNTVITGFLTNDSDPENDGITCGNNEQPCIQTFPLHGGLEGVGTDRWFYFVEFGYTGVDTLAYNVCDDLGLCTPTTVTLSINNQAPIAGNDAYNVPGRATTIGPFMVNDSDPEGDLIPRLDLVTLPQHGTLAGSFTIDRKFYRPAAGFNGEDNFTYKICDDLGGCSTTATVTLQVGAQPTPTPTPTPPPSPTPTPTPPEPLIFVPGITGSRLNERRVDGSTHNVWVGITNALPPVIADKSVLTLDPSLPQADIFVPDALRSIPLRALITSIGEIDVYGSLIKMLTDHGYREYQVRNDPNRRTVNGCDLTQRSDDPNLNPNLFVFAYDWRQSNIANTAALKSYVDCIKKFYPDSKVNILTHSMGGILARRYILDYPNGAHNVHKLVTIAAPWLGAPKAINVMETGDFDVPKIVIPDETLKGLALFFKSVHEILPTRDYFSLGGDPFGEKNWDVNEDRKLSSQFAYNRTSRSPGFINFLDDIRFRRSRPGTANRVFNDFPGQNDWHLDNSGVKYFHFYGVKRIKDTIGKLTAVSKPLCDAVGKCSTTFDFEKSYVKGDGTVPELSAERIAGTTNLNARGVVPKPFHGASRDVEHLALAKNPNVWSEVLSALATPDGPQALGPRRRTSSPTRAHHAVNRLNSHQDQDTDEPGYYVTVSGVDQILVTDDAGNTNEPLAGSSYSPGLPDVNYDLGLNSVSVVTPTIQSFTLTFQSRGKPIAIQAFKGIGTERPDQAIRYLDLNLTPGTVAMLGLSPAGVADLVYDADGDGVFESTVNPTSSVIGESAWDSEPPVITFSEVVIGGHRLLSLVPTDNQSGVRTVKYSFDGQQYETYGGPLDISGCGLSAIYAFADDNVANRSELFTYELPNLAPDVHAATPSIATLWPPAHRMVDISILGVADPDCDPFSIAITAVTQDESTNGSGDGHTCPDAEIVDGSTVRVRAERDGGGDGRVYTICFTATDSNGNVSPGVVKVSVPMSRNRQPVSGQLQFDSFRCDK